MWTREEIRENLILGEVEWLERAILAIYRQQTADEQSDGTTIYFNLRGFNRDDAWYGTYLAMYLLSGMSLKGLRPAYEWARQEMPKYAGQLARIANSNALENPRTSS